MLVNKFQPEVWLPLLGVGKRLMTWTPQRLPDLLASTAPIEVKMEEAGNIADKIAARYLADDKAAVKAMHSVCM